jgi:hypothetical protein
MNVFFPLSIVLIPYAIFSLIVAFFIFINLRNLVRYRAEDIISFGALLIFLAGLAFIGYFTYGALSGIDWTGTIEMGLPDIKGFKNPFAS